MFKNYFSSIYMVYYFTFILILKLLWHVIFFFIYIGCIDFTNIFIWDIQWIF